MVAKEIFEHRNLNEGGWGSESERRVAGGESQSASLRRVCGRGGVCLPLTSSHTRTSLEVVARQHARSSWQVKTLRGAKHKLDRSCSGQRRQTERGESNERGELIVSVESQDQHGSIRHYFGAARVGLTVNGFDCVSGITTRRRSGKRSVKISLP